MPEKPIAYRGSEPFVFVSYAHADAELAYPIISGLQERGMRIWFDDGLDVGDIWEDVIPDHVEQCSAMLCLVSPRFMDSNNCLDEIHYAKEQKKELMILHLEDASLPRNFQFRYSRFHALRLSAYSDRGALLDKLAAAEKLYCCFVKEQGITEESPEEVYQKGKAYNEAKSYKEAASFYRMAAEKGHPGAMRAIGCCYELGHGVNQSYQEALVWYRRAVALGDADAMRNMGLCYAYARGIPQSWEEAVKWYRRAADKGNERAMTNLGYCYEKGNGVEQSHREAAAWYSKGADKGNAQAMHNLGLCYHYGRGVSQSWEAAAAWYRRAADKGFAGAMHNLGMRYALGQGVEKDQKQAEYWRNKAKQAEAADASN